MADLTVGCTVELWEPGGPRHLERATLLKLDPAGCPECGETEDGEQDMVWAVIQYADGVLDAVFTCEVRPVPNN